MLKQTLKILDEAKAAKDYKTALQGIREARGLIALLAKLTQKPERRPEADILLSPEWQRIKSTLMTVLAPYPEIRATLAAKLMELDSDA